MYDIYYAHHQWKYGTKVEAYEIDVIKRYFPNAKIFNPSTDLILPKCFGEEAIMARCLETVRNSDILVFSSMDGVIGTGVYHEVEEAKRNGKNVFYIFQNRLFLDFFINQFDKVMQQDRLYATVDIGY